jgi:hypothetical protein
VPAVIEYRGRELAHKPYAGATIHQVESLGREYLTQLPGGRDVVRAGAGIGTREDTHAVDGLIGGHGNRLSAIRHQLS